MPLSKKTMLEARLRKRVSAVGAGSFAVYCDYLFSPRGQKEELAWMMDVITTNKTDFFREPGHFEYLVKTCLPNLVRQGRLDAGREVTVWSAGCATGEEPYTLAIVLCEFKETHPGFRYRILGTDISTQVLEKAKLGVYRLDRTDPIPFDLKKKYLLRGRDKKKGLVRIVPGLRALVQFRFVNFLDREYGIREPIDIVFCRNVIIYFDRATQERVIRQISRHIGPGGYLFLGHSETLFGLDVPFVQEATTVYRMPS